MNKVHVNLAERSYVVLCEYGALDKLGKEISSLNLSRHCALITDSNVDLHYASEVIDGL